MKTSDQFQYTRNENLDGVTLLSARMKDFSYPRHSHEEYSFGVTLSGDQHFFTQGELHRSKSGNVILFNPEDVHDGNSGSEEILQYLMLYVCPKLLNSFLQSAGLPKTRNLKISDPVLNSPKLHRTLLNIAGQIITEKTDILELEENIYTLAILLAEKYNLADHIQPSGKVDTLIGKAKDYIRDRISDQIRLDDLAEDLNISKFHFLRLFRQQTGITPYQYVLSCRLNKAQKALERADSVNDVVFDLGFSDVSHFNRRFKSVFGVTPNVYRKLLCN